MSFLEFPIFFCCDFIFAPDFEAETHFYKFRGIFSPHVKGISVLKNNWDFFAKKMTYLLTFWKIFEMFYVFIKIKKILFSLKKEFVFWKNNGWKIKREKSTNTSREPGVLHHYIAESLCSMLVLKIFVHISVIMIQQKEYWDFSILKWHRFSVNHQRKMAKKVIKTNCWDEVLSKIYKSC